MSKPIDWDALYTRHAMEFLSARQNYYRDNPAAARRIEAPSTDPYSPQPSRTVVDDGYRNYIDVPGMVANCFSYYY